MYGAETSLEGKTTKMANFQVNVLLFLELIVCLRIEIEQLEEKLKFIKDKSEWLNLSVERLTQDYNCTTLLQRRH